MESNKLNIVTLYGDSSESAMLSNDHINYNYDEEEIKVYRDLFPQLVSEIKDFLLKEYGFIKKEGKYDAYDGVEAIISRVHLNLNNQQEPVFEIVLPCKNAEESIKANIGDEFTIRINIHLPKTEIEQIPGFFKAKQQIVYKKMLFVIVAFHVQPLRYSWGTKIGITSSYGEKLLRYWRDNFDKFFEDIDTDDIIIDENFDVTEPVADIEEIIEVFHENVEKEYKRRCSELKTQQVSIVSMVDTNGDGNVDLADTETLNNLLLKHQAKIIEVDKNYIQKFVKIISYLKQKKANTQKIFETIRETKNEEELNERINLLRNQIHIYNLLVFHTISMITALVESDFITFYEIYECFDQLSVFNSNWENEISSKLDEIGTGISELLYSIYQMEKNVVNAINKLTYVTQNGFSKLNSTISTDLTSINSNLKFNNLLTTIQNYQTYNLKEKL